MKDQLLQKLTAYVDGELDPRERDVVDRLAQGDPSVRELLTLLQQDARRLRELPRVKAPEPFADLVLKRVAESRVQRKRHAIAPPRWLHYAAAAAIILGVGIGSHFLLQDVF